MAFFPTTAQITAEDILADLNQGGVGMIGAIIAALRADGLDYETAEGMKTTIALALLLASGK